MYFTCGSIPRAKKQETQWMLWVFCDKLAYLHHEVDATSNLYLDAQVGMNTSQHDLSSMQVLLKLLLFMEFNLFITSLIDRSSTRSSTGSSTSSSTCASSSAGQANSSHRFRISLAQSGIRALTMIFTKRSTSCFGRKETCRTLSEVRTACGSPR